MFEHPVDRTGRQPDSGHQSRPLHPGPQFAGLAGGCQERDHGQQHGNRNAHRHQHASVFNPEAAPVGRRALGRFDRGRTAGEPVCEPDIGPADQGMAKRHTEAQIERSQPVDAPGAAAPRQVCSGRGQKHHIQERDTGQQRQAQTLLVQQITGAEPRSEKNPETNFTADDEIYQEIHGYS